MTPGQNLASERDGDHGSILVLAVESAIDWLPTASRQDILIETVPGAQPRDWVP
jgi:hypothetical protein